MLSTRSSAWLLPAIGLGLVLVSSVGKLRACPFCSAVSQTFSEEMSSANVVVVAEIAKPASLSNLNTSDAQAEVPKSQFRVVTVLKGGEFIKQGDVFETVYFGEANQGRPFLAMATDAPKLMWSTPLILTDRAAKYVTALPQLPATADRLKFFQEYLEDDDEMLARDAYDEFAKAPYKDVIALKDQMNRRQLLEFIQDADVPSNRRRLYFTMLGVCGQSEDAKLLEELMASDDRKQKAGLDALLACYVLLQGAPALDRVDELFLRNREADYADTYASIMAIRFHGSEVSVVPRERLLESLRLMLDRPELADLVIPDLARWEDWKVMPRLVQLFINADENSSWVRVPVVNYLRACPLPEAAARIEVLKGIDPDAVKRAMTFFPLNTGNETPQEGEKKPKPEPTSSGHLGLGKTQFVGLRRLAQVETSNELEVAKEPETSTTEKQSLVTGSSEEAASLREMAPVPPASAKNNATSEGIPGTLEQAEQMAGDGPNLWTILFVTVTGGCGCFAAMRTVLQAHSQAT